MPGQGQEKEGEVEKGQEKGRWRRGGGEGEVEKGRWTGSVAVPGKPSAGGAAMDNLFLLHLRNNFCRGRGNPERDMECWDSWNRLSHKGWRA